jgi:hypothetical protein
LHVETRNLLFITRPSVNTHTYTHTHTLSGGTIAGYGDLFDEQCEPNADKEKTAAFEFREQPDLIPGGTVLGEGETRKARDLAPRWCA